MAGHLFHQNMDFDLCKYTNAVSSLGSMNYGEVVMAPVHLGHHRDSPHGCGGKISGRELHHTLSRSFVFTITHRSSWNLTNIIGWLWQKLQSVDKSHYHIRLHGNLLSSSWAMHAIRCTYRHGDAKRHISATSLQTGIKTKGCTILLYISGSNLTKNFDHSFPYTGKINSSPPYYRLASWSSTPG